MEIRWAQRFFSISPKPLTSYITMHGKVGTSGDVNTIGGQIIPPNVNKVANRPVCLGIVTTR